MELRKAGDDATPLFLLKADSSVWLSEGEAVAYVLSKQLDTYYRRERVAVEPPKGIYTTVAQCGMSGALLGPSNYHDYQSKIRKLHSERFAHLSFEAYKSRIRMVKDEALVQQWKEEQSSKDEFYPLTTPEGSEPVKLGSLSEVENHFRQNHAASVIEAIRNRVDVPGAVAVNHSSGRVQSLVRSALEDLRRFPLPLVHVMSRQFESKGLQIFKAHQNVTYIAPARPRYLDREATPISDALCAMLQYMETHASTPRAEQWKALVELRPVTLELVATARETAVAADLAWLLREGHVIDYAERGLEAVRKPVQSKISAPHTSSIAAQTGADGKTGVISTGAGRRSRSRRRRGKPRTPEVIAEGALLNQVGVPVPDEDAGEEEASAEPEVTVTEIAHVVEKGEDGLANPV